MIFKLRSYQQEAVDAVIAQIRRSVAACMIVLPTGAGKSLVVAVLAKRIHKDSGGKRVLCLAPTAELVTQNRKKFLAFGYEASLFSASAGGKSTRHPVVFGSPVTVANSVERFYSDVAAIIVDECHGITATLLKIIDSIREHNPRVRLVGMTATPHRMGTGYIYKEHYENGPTDESNARNPYFDRVVYELPAQYLIDNGFLNPPLVGERVAVGYSTSGLQMRGDKFTNDSIKEAFEGEERLTRLIVEDIVERVELGGYRSVMIFAATRDHAEEICGYLPAGEWVAVYGDTPKAQRGIDLAAFIENKYRYIVNQNILTTGFDAPTVDVIGVMRATESPALYQQIIGRGTRLCDVPYPDGRVKDHFLVLEYAENISRHFKETGDLFVPEIKARKPPEGSPLEVPCPDCGFVNTFTARPNEENLKIDKHGYFLDLTGKQLMIEIKEGRKGEEVYKEVPMPAHFGRRCVNVVEQGELRELNRCSYMWSFKSCPECGTQNDIAARKCSACRCEIVNPNDKLKEEAELLERDPHAVKTANITGVLWQRSWSRAGDQMLVITWLTDHRLKMFQKIEQQFIPDHEKAFPRAKWESMSKELFGHVKSIDDALSYQKAARLPVSITFQRPKGQKYPIIKRVDFE